jgi:hypothetical protein
MFTFMKMSLVLLLLSVVLPRKLFHTITKDKWHNWSKLYYSRIKLTLITMYKSSFLYIKWSKMQLWKLVCFIMQLKLNSATTYPNIVKKNSAPKKISYTMHNFPVYYVCKAKKKICVFTVTRPTLFFSRRP